MSRRRYSGFGSLHATALASKMRQQSDWTGKNYLFNIDCRWLADWAMSAYISKPIYLVFFTKLPIISSLSSPQAVPKPKIWWEIDVNISPASWCQCWPIFYFQGYIYSEKLINPAIRNVPSPQDIFMGCAAKTSYPGCVRRPNLPCAHYIWHYMMEHLFICLVHVGVVLIYFGRQ